MTNFLGYLGVNTEAMTVNDWLGLFFTIVVFIGMVYVYVMVFRPANRDKFEAQRGMALDDDDHINAGEIK